jgi:hypothetical protein
VVGGGGVTLEPSSADEFPPPAEPLDELPTWPQTLTETHKAEIKMITTLNINLKSVFIFNPIEHRTGMRALDESG